MRALVIHNFYRSENPSGENLSVADEVSGLRELGWDVELLTANSDAIVDGHISSAELAVRPFHSRRSVRRLSNTIRQFKPQVALVENVFPLHSPSVISVLSDAGIPVAAGVRSYRMWCANSAMFRDGKVCSDCIGSFGNLPAVRHRCYRDSVSASAAMAASLAVHRSTFQRLDALLPVSDHVADVLEQVGFDSERIVVRPNFVDDPGPPAAATSCDFLFGGRLTEEKGVLLLLEAWERSRAWESATLTIAGAGDLEARVKQCAPQLRVRPVGQLDHTDMMREMSAAGVMVVPSIWHEPFGRGVIEAAARGRGSVVTRRGGLASLVVDGETGWIADPEPAAFAEALARACDPAAQAAAGHAARQRFLDHYTRTTSLAILDDVLTKLAHREALPG